MRLPTARARGAAALSTLVATALLLTGCLSIAIPDDDPDVVVTPEPGSPAPSPDDASTQRAEPAEPTDTVVCDASGAVITGEGHRVRVTGTCAVLEVSGDRNHVDAEDADVDVLQIAGQDNEIEVGSVRAITLAGNDNEVDARSGAAALELAGDNNEIDLSGRLEGGIVRGNDNEIDADGTGPVIQEGQDNDVG
ncbi:DUF3060 domain-containing protein [Microbacterium sp. LRZ72]|uniref:DUF3060 domain-containing protein n=1 Tax=Microbacterium sp. LRZ72 TaxID=2942481 RepID=UPI0029BE74AA|nr:DUF3060 domain-containing protein [Microbacterium sp. LRZ72]MDX2375565.1 DUF3060 domain-containing protein [Microbacterium sp. LRZ72]